MLHLPPLVVMQPCSREPRESAHLFRTSFSLSSRSPSTHRRHTSSSSPTSSMSPPRLDMHTTPHHAHHAKSNRPSSSRSRGPPAPRIVVKKEPASPDMATTTTRHRPRRLDLSNHNIVHSSGALTARPSGLAAPVQWTWVSPAFPLASTPRIPPCAHSFSAVWM
jgi:hypothetical protein